MTRCRTWSPAGKSVNACVTGLNLVTYHGAVVAPLLIVPELP